MLKGPAVSIKKIFTSCTISDVFVTSYIGEFLKLDRFAQFYKYNNSFLKN